jgi:addiction module HigA family antidote
MAEYAAAPRRRPPTHPGEIVADVLGTLRVSHRQAAKAMHVTPMALSNVITGKAAVTPRMALRLGKLLGNGPEIWLRMQQDYELWHTSRELRADLEKIEPLKAA